MEQKTMFRVVDKEELSGSHKNKTPVASTELIDECLVEHDRLGKLLSRAKEKYQEKKFDDLYTLIGQSIKKSTDLCQNILNLSVSYGDPDGLKKLKRGATGEGSADSEKIQFVIMQTGLKIILPELLQYRISYNGIRKSMGENLDFIRYKYVPQFEHFFNDKKIRFDERVVILYKHYYQTERLVKDDDNFDYKIITDLISEYVLVDDSPKYCMKVYDYEVGAVKNHTEITIFPCSEWLNFIELPFR